MDRPLFDGDWKPPVNPDDLSKFSVTNDKWDQEDLTEAMKDVASLRAARENLGKFGATAEDSIPDAFFALLKAEPDLIPANEMRPDHRVNHAVADEMLKLNETEQLRRYSVNDPVQAALSTVALEKDLETVYDRLKKQQEQAEELQKRIDEYVTTCGGAQAAQDDVDEMIARAKGDGSDGQPIPTPEDIAAAEAKAKAAREAAEKAQQDAQQAEEEFKNSMNEAQGQVREDLKAAVGKEAQNAADAAESARAWGLETTTLKKMDPTARIELAKRLNTPKFKRIADLFGPMRNLMATEQARKTTHSHDEIFDVGIGGDLSRVLPTELLNLREGPTRLDFLRRLAEGKLLQYELQGTEKLGRGGIVFCEDGSGSMQGERTIWAKAVGLALVHLAKQQNREIRIYHFSGPNNIQEFSFTKPEDFAIDKILSYAEAFWGGGTEYTGPMKRGLKNLVDEFANTGKTKSDMVFCTDGECYVEQGFMDTFIAEMKRIDGTVWGIDVSGGREVAKDGALYTMCEGKVATIKTLVSGEDIRQVFRQVA